MFKPKLEHCSHNFVNGTGHDDRQAVLGFDAAERSSLASTAPAVFLRDLLMRRIFARGRVHALSAKPQRGDSNPGCVKTLKHPRNVEGQFSGTAAQCQGSIASALGATALFWSHHSGLCGTGGLRCDKTGRPMDSKLSPVQADPHHDRDVVLVAPKDWRYAEEAPHVASNRRHPTAGRDFSAGPRLTESSLDPTLRPADVINDPLPTDRTSRRRRTSRGLTRFLMAACVGIATTLAWQSYGGTAKQMIANLAPQLHWLSSPPAMNPPSGREIAIEQSSPPQASAPQAPSAQVEAAAPTASGTALSTAPTAPSRELRQQFEMMEQELAAVRQSVEQLAAGQEQLARDIAKLHIAGQDTRRRTAFPPVATTARKPVPPPQPAPQSSSTAPFAHLAPEPAPQPATAPLTYPPSEPAPQSSTAPLVPEPPRPPMPVR
jgi:hypothetical protein